MKAFIVLSAIFILPLLGFSQNGIEKLKELANTLSQPQDTAKPKSGSGGQSNLAVSDEGAGGGKSKSQKTTGENPIEKLKKNLAEKAAQNNSGSNSSSSGSATGAGNLAVSDEGASGTKGKSTSRENTSTESTNTVTPSATDPAKTTTAPK